MIRSTLYGVTVCVVFGAPLTTHAQMRRSAPPGDGARAPAAAEIVDPALRKRFPFAGAWEGELTMQRGPGRNEPRAIAMVFTIADTSRGTYAGATINPGHGRAPHDSTRVERGELHWQQPNSGGGQWFYVVRLATPDSIVGTLALRDWPQLPAGEQPPVGDLVLRRRR
jgi:hypothetical protein